MKLLVLVSSLAVLGLVFALSGVPTTSLADSHKSTCETCGKSSPSDCPHCASGKECPHCDKGKTCPHCGKTKSCAHCGHHGKWGGHQWDYKCVRPAKKPDAMSKQFSALGADGWRLIEADGGIWCFAKMNRAQ